MTNKPFVLGGAIIATMIAITGIILPIFVEKIPTGHVGLVYSPSGGVQEQTLGECWHVVGLFDIVIEYPTKLPRKTYEGMILATKDGENISVDLSYSSKVDPTITASTIFRIPTNQREEDLHYYDLRHSDVDWCEPVSVESGVMVNYFGTIAPTEPLGMGEYHAIYITDEESKFLCDVCHEMQPRIQD